MKKFTVKDFLSYNNPCFSCGSNINFYFVISTKALSKAVSPAHITPLVSQKFIALDLKRSYSHSLTLTIDNKTNKFIVNNKHELQSFILDNNISLVSTCATCHTNIMSNAIIFDLKEKFIKPTDIFHESLHVDDAGTHYSISTLPAENLTHIEVGDSANSIFSTVFAYKNNNNFKLDTPALPLYKIKNKENLIKKIRIYLTFS